MQNNGTIPNVSMVFRELIKISTTNPQLNTQNQTDQFRSTNNYSYGNNTHSYGKNDNKYQSSFPSTMVENDRQQRHEALMCRLKNSMNENRQLLGVQESPLQKMNVTAYNYDRSQTQVSSFNSNPYSQNEFSPYQNTGDQFIQKNGKWAPPKIKYRHIQDVQQKSVSMESNTAGNNNTKSRQSTQNQINLKNQFYESTPLNNSQFQNKQNFQRRRQSNQINKTQQMNQSDQQEQNDHHQEQDNDEQQNLNKLSIMSQKPSKYNQNLQSYYDICRKPIKPLSGLMSTGVRNEEKNTNTEKFMRKQTPKVEGINLEKAMRILSLDD